MKGVLVPVSTQFDLGELDCDVRPRSAWAAHLDELFRSNPYGGTVHVWSQWATHENMSVKPRAPYNLRAKGRKSR